MVERDAMGDIPGEVTDLSPLGDLLGRIVAAHERRMESLGLAL